MNQTDKLYFKDIVLEGRQGYRKHFYGALLGTGSSERDTHNHDGDIAPAGHRCSACRWYEAFVYLRRTKDQDDYIVYTVGETIIPGETRFSRIEATASPYDVVELLTVRKRDAEPYLPMQASRALAQAAELDNRIRDAYINRAVV